MSLVRRVKSFSIKKYLSNDELKSDDSRRPTPRPRKKILIREKSLSMDEVPLVVDIEKNDLFVKQRTKIERSAEFVGGIGKKDVEEEKRKTPVPHPRKVNLKKRQSVSYDDVRFSRCIQEFKENPVQLRSNNNGGRRMMSRYKTIDVVKFDGKTSNIMYNRNNFAQNLRKFQKKPIEVVNFNYREDDDIVDYIPSTNLVKSKSDWYINLAHDDDLITEFDTGPKSSVDNLSKPANFPVGNDEELQLRNVKSTARVARPQTYSSSLTRSKQKKDNPLLFKGVHRLEIDEDICIKIRTSENLRYQNGYLQLLDERGNTKATIRNNLNLKSGAKLIGKKEVEMRDINDRMYKLYFDSSKDAKLFIEIEKIFSTVPTASPYRNVGPWFQLKKLLKKRSSRDFLESKGIIKNEPIFGNTLEELCEEEHPVPEVVTKIVNMIEEKENITSLGLYRASANLAIVQNIRCQIDYGNWDILEKYSNDVDVLAGTLKLFFRELKEPLISHEVFQDLKNRSNDIPKILEKLSRPNRDTLLYIIRHLLKVCQHKDENKMDFHNISIVWGPTLITFPETCTDLVAQTTEFTRVTEDLLIFYSNQKIDVREEPKRVDFGYEVIRKLTEAIESQIETEGIYRKSGSNRNIDRIMKQLEKKNLDELDLLKNDIHDLCCVLKKFVTSIRESIVPDEFFQWYCSICDSLNDNDIQGEVRRRISQFPRKEIIYLLFQHLNKVVLYERKNKMAHSVLSDIWMTTLMANVSAQTYKKKLPKYTKLFLILMNLNESVLPDLVADSKTRTWSKYDNVPDDIQSDGETSDERVNTKL